MADEAKSPAEVRAEMSRALLVQMAASGDEQTRANATTALQAQGLGPNGMPLTAAPAPAPAPTPAAAPVVNQPAASPAAAPASPAGPVSDAALEAGRDANGLIFGKYRTVEEAKRGYYNAVNTLSTTTDELVRLRNQSASGQPAAPAVLPGSAPGDAPRVNPTQRQIDYQKEIDELVKSSEESGALDPNALMKLVTRVASSAASEAAVQAVEAQVTPMRAMAEAESYMRTTYPDSINHAQELGNFVKTDPTVGPTVQSLMATGQYKAAFEYAWNMYTVKNGISAERAIDANSAIAEEERQRARAAAGFSGSPNTGVHAAVPDPNRRLTPEEVAALNEHSIQDQGQLRRRVMLGRFLPPEWRTWENQNQ